MTRNPNTRIQDIKINVRTPSQPQGFTEAVLALFVTGVALIWAVIIRYFFH